MQPSILAGSARAPKRRSLVSLVLASVLTLAACGGSDPSGIGDPNPDVAPFVGTWEAVAFEVTNLADEEQVFDVVAAGSFTLNVQPSGFYTAILHISGGQPIPENGKLSVIGESVRLSPTGGTGVTAEYEFQGPDRVELNGPTEFDFNFDGEPETASAYIVLERT